MSEKRLSRVLAAAAGLALALFLNSCATSSDLSGSLVGKVRDADSSQPIPGAVIECEGNIAVSTSDGSYSLDGIPPGDRVVWASASGYEPYSQVVNIQESTYHDISMDEYVAPARLFGYVSHATLGPLEGAEVTIGDLSVFTDSLGYYEYANLEQTSYSMTVTKDGYRSVTQNVHPTSENYRFDVSVKKLETATLTVSADAPVIMGSPGMNFGAATELNLYNNESSHERFYISFDLSEIEDTAEPVTATLWLYSTWDQGVDSRVFLVAEPLAAWQELGVTWANGPQTTGATIALSTYASPWYNVDITTYVRDWLVDDVDNFGLLVDTPVNHTFDRLLFASREYAVEDDRPYVDLEYAW